MGTEITKGSLFVVSTPIGNLSDITFRAVDILKSVDVIACEDTRNTSVLCEKYSISTKLVSYHKFSESQKTEGILRYLDAGKSVALVSDAGTPLISDPGVKLVTEARNKGFDVVPIVGASAVMALLSSIPRQGEDFKFIGFLPRIKNQIENTVKAMSAENLVFYESPNRLISTLEAILNVRKDAKLAIGRELTKKFEEIKVDTAQNLIEYYKVHVLKGEIACMLYALEDSKQDDFDLTDKILKLKELKLTDRDIVSVLNSLYNVPRNKIKETCLNLSKQ